MDGAGLLRPGTQPAHSASKWPRELQGEFPETLAGLCDLPGVGRSTAGAIRQHRLRAARSILDGNVKRVLARYHRVEGWPGQIAVTPALWDIAEQYTPAKRCADYTQAMMDLGATLCTRVRPACDAAPCERLSGPGAGDQRHYPGKKPRKSMPVKATRFLMRTQPRRRYLAGKTPASGIWGGLWCFPEVDDAESAAHAASICWGLEPR